MSKINETLSNLSADSTRVSDYSPKMSIDEEEKHEHVRGLRQDIDERKHYAERAFNFLCMYMFMLFFVLILAGFDTVPFHFSDTVIIALITTTTANVIGIFHFVMRYLFNGKK